MRDPELLRVLFDLGVDLADGFLNVPESELIEALAVEYAMLFLGPGEHISPHESVHRKNNDGKPGLLWGKSTVEVKRFIEFPGLHYTSDYTGPPDHISVELEFMQQATLREGQAWEEGDETAAKACLKYDKQFHEEHLMCWIPDFCDKVMAASKSPLYREMASLTKTFIEFESRESRLRVEYLLNITVNV